MLEEPEKRCDTCRHNIAPWHSDYCDTCGENLDNHEGLEIFYYPEPIRYEE